MNKIKLITFVLATSLLIVGCGGEGGSSPTSVVELSVSNNPVGTEFGRSVYELGQTKTQAGRVKVWASRNGTTMAPEKPVQIVIEPETGRATGSRLFFDETGVPRMMTPIDNGFVVAFSWQGNVGLAKFYQANGDLVGIAKVDATTSTLKIEPETSIAIQGTYDCQLAGLTDGILVFTVQSDGTSARFQTSKPTAPESRAPIEVPHTDNVNRDLGFLTHLSDAWPTAAVALQNKLSDEAKRGETTTMNALIDAGTLNSSSTAAFKVYSAALTNLFSAPKQVGGAVAPLLAKSAQELTTSATVKTLLNSNSVGDFGLTSSLPILRTEADYTKVQGLVFAQELDAIQVNGSINSTGSFQLAGSNSTSDISLSGAIDTSDGSLTGTWSLANRADGGSMTGNRTQQATCSTQTQSGGQGGSSRVYNLGTSCGTFSFFYEHYTIPDRVRVYHGDALLFDTGGLVSGAQTVMLDLTRKPTPYVQVLVDAPESGTAWYYILGCPGQRPTNVPEPPVKERPR